MGSYLWKECKKCNHHRKNGCKYSDYISSVVWRTIKIKKQKGLECHRFEEQGEW